MQMNYTVCLMNAEYVEYGTFDQYADELHSMCNECWVIEYGTFEQYADELYSVCNECRVCRIWYIW